MESEESIVDPDWSALVQVGCYPSLRAAHDHVLVVLAMGEECWLREEAESPDVASAAGGFSLMVEPGPAPRIVSELAAFDSEEARRPLPQTLVLPRFSSGFVLAWVWMVSLLAVFLLQGRDPSLVEKSVSSSLGLIEAHEWWRPFTALFLHADMHHLLGNLLTGLFFSVLLSRSIGPLTAWSLILGSGAMGNALCSWLNYPQPMTSLGASTAVFAALGGLTGVGFATSLRLPSGHSWARVLLPVIGGIVLLGWLGGGGPETDVLGHACGFAVGSVAGWAAGRWRLGPKEKSL